MQFKHFIFCSVFLVTSATGLSAQTLIGRVTDQSGAGIGAAIVTATHAETGAVRHISTDSSGEYRIAALAAGDYAVDVDAAGFGSRIHRLHLAVGQARVLDVTLHLAGATEAVDVVAPFVQRSTTELGGLIDRREILELPVNGRSYEQLALLEPGVVSTTSRETSVLYQHGLKINANGAGSRSNAFLLDGTAVTDFYNNGLGSVAGTMLGIEAVREFQVLTNSYSAEHAGASGALVRIVTKSGAHEIHGSGFAFLRDDRLDARNYFDDEQPDFWRRQAGFSLGGPLVRQRAFYFATGEWLRESLGLTQRAAVPTLQARAGELPDLQNPGRTIAVSPAVEPFLALFPLPNGRDLGGGLAEHVFTATRPTHDSFGQGRVDVRVSETNSLFGRVTVDRGDKVEPGRYPDQGVEWDSDNRFVTVEDAHVFSSSLVNTTRFSYSVTDIGQLDTTGRDAAPELSVIPGRPIPHLVIGGMPTFGTLVSPNTHARQRLFALSDDVAIAKGRHLLKAGALLERFRGRVEFDFFWGGRYSFPDVRRFLQARPSVLSIALDGSESERELFTTQFGVYAQDEVRLTPDLTLNAGVRWEFSTAPRETEDRLVALVDPLRDTELVVGTLLRTPKNNIAPRFGLAWTPGGTGHSVVRAGMGVFHEINTLPYVAQTVGTNPPFFRQITVSVPAFPRPQLNADPILSLGVPQYDWHTPRLYHFNVAYERELPGRITTAVAYAGSRGRNIVRSGDINAPVPQVLPDGTHLFAQGAARRNPAFGAIAYRIPDGRSTYDGLHVKVTRRSTNGLQVQGSYTLSRTIDETQGTVPTEALGSVTQWMDPDRPETDRGPADFNRRHNLTASFIWNLPFFRASNATAQRLLADWSISGIITARSGNPFTVGIQSDYSRTLARVSVHRPNLRPGFDLDDVILGRPEQYFDPQAFELQAPGTFGNVTRNSLEGPGVATVDLALVKRVGGFGTGRELQVRIEAFNLLNRANFGLPQRIVFAGTQPGEAPLGTAGRISSTTTSAREIQLGLKFVW